MMRRFIPLAALALLALAPAVLGPYGLNLLIQIGYLGIAALGLNILVGCSGQISVGQGAFFGFGAFASAFIANRLQWPVWLAIPLAGVATTAVGLVFGLPATRLKGLYLAIATLAAQLILQDFFGRAGAFTGGVAGTPAPHLSLLGHEITGDGAYFHVVLAVTVVMVQAARWLLRSREGRALLALRDHALSAEMMGIHPAAYRTLAFGIAAFYAGIGGALYAHYLGFVSVEGFDLAFSIQLLAMVIIGGLASIPGTLLGTAFMVLLPEAIGALAHTLAGSAIDRALSLHEGIAFLKEMAIGAVIVVFLLFQTQGLARPWRRLQALWSPLPTCLNPPAVPASTGD